MGMHSPIEQFEVHDMTDSLFNLSSHPIAFSNYSLAVLLVVVLGAMFMILPVRRRSVIPGRWQVLVETIFSAIENVMLEAAGPKAKPFLPYIFLISFHLLLMWQSLSLCHLPKAKGTVKK